MSLRIHYSTSILLAFYMMTGRFAEYVIIVLSLIVHECGHLLGARLVGVKVKSICFYMYGADLRFQMNFIGPYQQLVIACCGPAATLLLMVVCMSNRSDIFVGVIEMQKLLLLINLCPIWPLDGGRIVQGIMNLFHFPINDLLFLKVSLIISVISVIAAIFLVKPFFLLLFAVVCQQILLEIKQFPLRRAYQRLVLKEK